MAIVTVEGLKNAGKFVVRERIRQVDTNLSNLSSFSRVNGLDPSILTTLDFRGQSFIFEYKDGQLTISNNEADPVQLEKAEETLEALEDATKWKEGNHRFYVNIYLKNSISFTIYYPEINLSLY